MKNFLVLIFCVLVLFVKCTKDENIVSSEGLPLSLTAVCGSYVEVDDLTKVNSVFSWEEENVFGLFERQGGIYTNSNIEFTIADGVGSNTATFTGESATDEGWSLKEKKFLAYYPYDKTQLMASELIFSVSTSQIQDVENQEGHLYANNCMISTTDIAESDNTGGYTITFKPLLAKIDFQIINETSSEIKLAGVDYKSVDGTNLFFSSNTFNLYTQSFSSTVTADCSELSVSFSDSLRLASGESYTASVVLLPTTIAANTEIVTSVRNSRKEISISSLVSDNAGLSYGSAYTYTETISLTDELFDDSEAIILDNDQNSFIINPPVVKGKSGKYMLPITRVNTYWGTDYANVSSNMIESDTKWIAEIIWKDVDITGTVNLVEFIEGNDRGVGPLDRIGIKVNYDEAEPYGNAVIGVKMADDNYNPVGDYLWSWHIWVTDFNIETDLQDCSGTNGYVTMDRNLGAKSNVRGDVGCLGLLYQWGRKDPFIGASATSFDGDETMSYAPTTMTWPDAVPYSVGGTTDYVVNHPTTFITSYEGDTYNPMKSDWMITPDSYLWSNSEKTIYDPSPKGFKVARRNSWSGLSSDIFVFDEENRGRATADGVWYPAAGCRRGETNTLENVGTYGYCVWSSGSATKTVDGVLNYYARTMFYYNTSDGSSLDVDYRASRAHGATVRCMRWEEDD